jgi:hypothetical protein
MLRKPVIALLVLSALFGAVRPALACLAPAAMGDCCPTQHMATPDPVAGASLVPIGAPCCAVMPSAATVQPTLLPSREAATDRTTGDRGGSAAVPCVALDWPSTRPRSQPPPVDLPRVPCSESIYLLTARLRL